MKKHIILQNIETEKNIVDIESIIKEIDARIAKYEKEEEEKAKEVDIDVEDLTRKINERLAALDEIYEDDLEKTLYDLSEISNAINETIKALEAPYVPHIKTGAF